MEDIQQCIDYVNQDYGYGLETRLLDRQDFLEEKTFSMYRQAFWFRLFKRRSSRGERIEVKEMIKKMISFSEICPMPSLGDLECYPVAKQEEAVHKCEPRKEIPMRTESDIKRDHLYMRLNRAESDKTRELEQFFGLMDDDWPTNPKELVKRIQEGRFVIRERNECDFDGALEGIRFRDPAKKEDHDGFRKAHDAMYEAYRDAQDAVAILEPLDGLKAVNEFKAKTFH